MARRVFAAIDIGASGGRLVAGVFDGRALELETVCRFANDGVRLPTGWHWNFSQLFRDIRSALAKARESYGDDLVSVSVDTWGVDYGLLDKKGRLLGLPWMYRDSRTDGVAEALAARIPRAEIYRRTGIQFLPFNTIYQLAAEARDCPEALAAADRLLFAPDLLTYWLSGEKITERTIASTSQLLKVGRPEWDLDLAASAGLPTHIFHPLAEPCSVVGALRPELELGALRVVACGGHDTASAVAGLPAVDENPLFLSSGTWSLIGRELPRPFVTDETCAAGFSNEHGVGGRTRFLKNITGMWLLQECARAWGSAADLPALIRNAASCQSKAVIDPDAGIFQKPGDMPAAIAAWLEQAGQRAPQSREETVSIILQSLAIKCGQHLIRLREWMPDLPSTLHIVGGGSQNATLNQWTADATGLTVEAGPSEATAAGNVLAQMIAMGDIASLAEGRRLLRASFAPAIFEPRDHSEWREKAVRAEGIGAGT